MGGGANFSYSTYSSMVKSRGYDKMSMDELLDSKDLKTTMSPRGVKIRESRDSVAHPTTLAIMMWLDETGSMGKIPAYMVREGLGHLLPDIIAGGVDHPQVFFGGIGDHYSDNSYLQVGQFECETELLDECLRSVYLEKKGGGQHKESYPLAWYFAGNHTSIDCFEKRGQKGILITIGDEGYHPIIEGKAISRMTGHGDYKESYTAEELLKKAQETYEVYHINANDGGYPNDEEILGQWRSLLGDHFINVEHHTDIPKVMVELITKHAKAHGTPAPAKPGKGGTIADIQML